MKKFLMSAAAVAVFAASSAVAADLPRKAPPMKAPVAPVAYSWTGLYFGIQGGWGWGNHDRQILPAGFRNSYNSNGGLVGGHIGYNFQFNPLVLGVEVDGAWADIKGNDGGAGGTTDQTKASSLFSVRGRLGFAVDRFLIFGTGGWGWARLEHTNIAGVPIVSNHDRNGWTAGAGVQYAFTDNWSLGVEYRRYEFGKYSSAPVGLAPFSVDSKINTFTGRISYKF